MPDSSPPAFAIIDFSRFQWRHSPDDANLYIREAGGGEAIEDVWNRFNHREQTLFFGAEISLRKGVPVNAFILQARNAWKDLRFKVPTLAAKTAYDAAGYTLITYRPAASHQEVDEWAERTVRRSEDVPNLDELRYELSKKYIPEENGDQTFLYVLPSSETSYSLLIHTTHISFDGGGIKIICNRLLSLLAKRLSGVRPRPPLAWGSEAENLLPCSTEVLGPDQEREGERYIYTFASVMSEIAEAMPRMYGFKLRNVGPGPTRRLGYDFSVSDSEQIFAKARACGFTVNQLAHAALNIVAALDNLSSSPPPDAAIICYGLVDARKYLMPPYNSRDGYPGYCLAMSMLQFPLRHFPTSSSLSPNELRESLLKVASVVKAEYLKQQSYPCLPAVSAQGVDVLINELTRSGKPFPPPWMSPWYSGDGIGEIYLDHEHKDEAGDTVLELDDFFMALNKTDPGPFFRVTSWKGRLKLSVDTNVVAMSEHLVRRFVDKWVQILLSL